MRLHGDVDNDTSVLEQYHCSQAFQLLLDSKHSILNHLDNPTIAELRRMIIPFILSIDSTTHQSQLAVLQQVAPRIEGLSMRTN